MAKVECYTPEGKIELKEPVDAREAVELCGYTMEAPGEMPEGLFLAAYTAEHIFYRESGTELLMRLELRQVYDLVGFQRDSADTDAGPCDLYSFRLIKLHDGDLHFF